MVLRASHFFRNYWYLAFALLVGVAFVMLLSWQATGTSPLILADGAGSGSLTVEGVSYKFEPETCFIGPDSFVAAGSGTMAGESYRISASPSEIELAFGVADEATAVPEGSRWLSTASVVEWTSDSSTVTAAVELFPRDDPDSAPQLGSLVLNCVAD